jgi:hypothetical protein
MGWRIVATTPTGGDMEPEKGHSFSIQAELIRQIQEEHGQTPCYATPTADNCSRKKEEQCRWRHDCYCESEEDKARRGGGTR